jgi:hypothetical protein
MSNSAIPVNPAAVSAPTVAATGQRTRRTRRWKWVEATEPFSALGDPDQPALFVVEQISDKDFRIPVDLGFQYNPQTGEPITVTCTSLPKTDFASIPRFMSWFVSRHGRHTPAALVHDKLVTDGMPFADRKQADRLFLEMMDDLEVPPVQSRVMWAAVVLATRRKGTAASKIGLTVWAALAAGGICLFVWGVSTLTPWMIAVALLGPAAAALFWGDQRSAGLVAGYALPVVALPALASLLGYWAYWLVEQTVKAIRRTFRHNKEEDLADPIGYQGR